VPTYTQKEPLLKKNLAPLDIIEIAEALLKNGRAGALWRSGQEPADLKL
jgi:hypothetical protein